MDNSISIRYPQPWEKGGWQGHWGSALQGCKSTGRRLEPRPRNLRWIRGTMVKQLMEIFRACRMRNKLLLLGQISWHERGLHLSFASAKSSVIPLESNHLRRNSSNKVDFMRNSKCPLHILFIFKPCFYGMEVVELKAPPDCSSASH